MFNKKVLAVAIVAATTVGTVAQVSAMELSEKGIGQALIGPVYYAEGSYKTHITVVNTRTDAAVKAKVVFRSHVDSVEVLDFLLYLSPADVWRGTVEGTGTTGEAQITSSDDSMRVGDDSNGVGGKGGDEATITQVFNTAATGNLYGSTDTNDWGHIDVLGVYAIPTGTYNLTTNRDYDSDGTAESSVVVKRTMTKAALAALFDEIDDSQSANRNANFNDCTVEALQANATATNGSVEYGAVSSISPCALELTGLVTIGVDGSHRASYTMHAMNAGHPSYPKMGDNFFGSTTQIGAGLGDGGAATEAAANPTYNPITGTDSADLKIAVDHMLVVANYQYNEARSANSHLTYDWGLACGNTATCSGYIAASNNNNFNGGSNTKSNLQQYDAAIARTITSWEYDAVSDSTTNGVVTFPTKYLHRHQTNNVTNSSINFFNSPCGDPGDGSATSVIEYYSYPFPQNGNVARSYTTYDNSENTSTSPENDFSGGATSSSGTFPDEVNYLTHASINYYSESTGGWGFIRYTNSAPATVTGGVNTTNNPADGTCRETRFGQAVSYTGFPALTLIYKIGSTHRIFEKTQDMD